MSGIVCAIRGGPSSQPTIQRAIRAAKENQIPIYFLYIVNLDFLSHSEQSRTHVIQQEMQSLGEFICLKAQLEARREGVEANAVVREGSVGEEIIALCREITADYVVLGRPQEQENENVFDHERLQKFAASLEQQTGAKALFP